MKRYDYICRDATMEEEPDGYWVPYTDAAALEAERDALRKALESSRVALTYAIGALQGGLADSDRPYLINVLVNDEQAARVTLGEGR